MGRQYARPTLGSRRSRENVDASVRPMPALQLRLRTTCSTCGHTIPLVSAHLPIACPACDAASPVDARAFSWVARERVTERGETEGTTLLGVAEPSDVKCAICGAVAAEEAIERGLARSELRCGCGNVITVRKVPDGIDRNGWWSALVGETSREKPATSATPVAFECPECGGALQVDGTMRTPTCTSCNTRVHLPDALWRALRPAPTAVPFYLWVRGDRSDGWEARRSRALFVSLTVAGTGTALAVVAGIAATASGYGAGTGFSDVELFFSVLLVSFIAAGVLNVLLSPKHHLT